MRFVRFLCLAAPLVLASSVLHAGEAPPGPAVQAASAALVAGPDAASAPAPEAPAPEARARRIAGLLSHRFGVAREKAEKISAAVLDSASRYALPPALLLAIISIESRFQEKAHGLNGATGLMQVVPSAHRQLVRHVDLTEPVANIEAGSAILSGYLQATGGDLDAALKRYGGSHAYAEKVASRVPQFTPAATPAVEQVRR